MSSFANLPLLIINKVIRYVINDRKYCSRTEKSAFTYLKICSIWRRIAVSKYYSQAYYYDYYEDENETDTNLDLITSVSNTRHARHLYFHVYHVYQFIELLLRYQTLLKAHENDWSSIENIEICYYNDISVPDHVLYNERVINLLDQFGEFANYITTHMPAIKDISLFYLDITNATKAVNNIFLSSYSRQLVSLNGHFISCFENDFIFDNLVNLELMVNPIALQALPRINYSKVRSLSLQHIPFNFKWDSLFTDRTVTKYTFAALNMLNMSFSTNYTSKELEEHTSQNEANNADYKMILHFPKLMELTIHNTASWFVSKTKHYFSNRLMKISLFDASNSYSMIEKVNFKDVRVCKISFSQQTPTWNSGFYRLTNSTFNIDPEFNYKKSVLKSNRELSLIDWNKSKWNNLTCIKADICNLQTFFAYHKHCPQLKTIKMLKMVFDMPSEEACNMFGDPSSTGPGSVVQTNNRIERLRIRGFKGKMAYNHELESFIKFYLRWASSLMYVKLDNCQWMDLEGYIESESQQSPSLGNIFLRY